MSETNLGSVCFFCAVNFDVKIWLNRQWIYLIGCDVAKRGAINQTHKKKAQRLLLKVSFC